MIKLLVTLTGPSYSGKSTLEKRLAAGVFGKVISTTTRAPRAGEEYGVDYYFTSREAFTRDTDKFVEHLEFNDDLYGIHSGELQRLANLGEENAVVVAEPNGVAQIRAWCENNGVECISFYLDTPLHVCFQRMVQRFSNEDAEKEAPKYIKRVATLNEEFKWKDVWKDVCSWIVLPNHRDPLAFILQTLSLRNEFSEEDHEKVRPPLPPLPALDVEIDGEPSAYSRKRLQDFASQVADVMFEYGTMCGKMPPTPKCSAGSGETLPRSDDDVEITIERLIRIATDNSNKADRARTAERACLLYKRAEKAFIKAGALGWKG